MQLWGAPPPEPRTRLENWPTLLFSWWATGFAAFFILARLCGRKFRSGVLFREDWIMMASMIPLFIRMALIHVVLLYGTNNIQTIGYEFSDAVQEHRSLGARLVLPARIFYAMTIWSQKLVVSEFLKRITMSIWRRSYEVVLQGIRVFLLMTFFAVVIATLTECRPFHHYWQVIPDPGPHCRLGYAQLFTMGTCDIITDILLVAFPIPIVLRSGQTWQRKVQLISLFSLSIVMIAVTATRIPEVILHRGRQQLRTVWASCEILASTCVSNAVIIGSFLRDKGTKKNKFRSMSMTDSIDRASVRRPTLTALQRMGSDEDLFRSLGCRIPQHLLEYEDEVARPAPAALSAAEMKQNRDAPLMSGALRVATRKVIKEEVEEDPNDVTGPLPTVDDTSPAPATPSTTKRSMSFFDVGGLLEDGSHSWDSRSRSTTIVDSGASGTIAMDFAPTTPEQSRRGSNAFMTDMGGIGLPAAHRNGNGFPGRRHSDVQMSLPRYRHAPTGVLGPMLERHETQQSLQDPGGLLGDEGGKAGRGSLRADPSAKLEPLLAETSAKGHGGQRDTPRSSPLLVEDGQNGVGRVAIPTIAQKATIVTNHPASVFPPAGHASEDMALHDPGGLLT
ncbi:hypothetical protein LTR78_009851 [Recurvomyces mirabilis]|uniref:Rhodopsin domain-containing protein n=1 Tax=Recurvomyces mirabilis TaxID=574656 RepID=A0AAE0WH82_9PEZI|nr:hypothetical protein LTR78_009851 [Recurvomyces mirabilis]KAK5153087.1 hypothetical protein LTS14_007731 [Recurvomyces mirabilis]